MPVVYQNIEGNTIVLLWAITECEDQLRALVSIQDRASADRFLSSARRMEHLAWRAALRQIVGKDSEICYDATGAPYIKNDVSEGPTFRDEMHYATRNKMRNVFISAAHTRGMAAVIVSDKPCAIDLESITRNLNNTSTRFISPAERMLPGFMNHDFPVTIWCAKEALYKFSQRRKLDFLTDLQITASDTETGQMTGRIGDAQGIPLNVLHFDGYVAVYIKS